MPMPVGVLIKKVTGWQKLLTESSELGIFFESVYQHILISFAPSLPYDLRTRNSKTQDFRHY